MKFKDKNILDRVDRKRMNMPWPIIVLVVVAIIFAVEIMSKFLVDPDMLSHGTRHVLRVFLLFLIVAAVVALIWWFDNPLSRFDLFRWLQEHRPK